MFRSSAGISEADGATSSKPQSHLGRSQSHQIMKVQKLTERAGERPSVTRPDLAYDRVKELEDKLEVSLYITSIVVVVVVVVVVFNRRLFIYSVNYTIAKKLFIFIYLFFAILACVISLEIGNRSMAASVHP